jgi:hypothetical protein
MVLFRDEIAREQVAISIGLLVVAGLAGRGVDRRHPD